MRTWVGGWLVALFVLHAPSASAESLRCNGWSATEGDSQLSVQYKCGQPMARASFCAAVYDPRSNRPVTDPFGFSAVPCQPIEEWLYDRGPGNMMATVRFRSGVVQSISYSRSPP